MNFGKIDYINLLPFHVFLKKTPLQTRYKQATNRKKSYPANINKLFLKRKVDAAFVSSIVSKKKKSLDAGIVARGEVLSVLTILGESQKDKESQSSNALADILGIKGQTLIGDKALKYYFSHEGGFVDLGEEWYKRHNLPFVFARFCYNKEEAFYKNLVAKFLKTRVKIPRYILKEYAKRADISGEQLLYYLTKIHYRIDAKAKKSLKKFLALV